MNSFLKAIATAPIVLMGCHETDVYINDSHEDLESTTNTSQAVETGLYDIGIIPDTAQCPHASELITIHMDDEDHRNQNDKWGYNGAIVHGDNTDFNFCRIDGSQLKPLTSTSDPQRFYAVLQLGPHCPPGSVGFSRLFDNEDKRTANSVNASFGNSIHPNSVGDNTTLHFCFFANGTDTMDWFPDLGIGYGVLAANDFIGDLAKGWIYIDDEDSHNQNRHNPPPGLSSYIEKLVSSGENTRMSFAKVR